MPWLQQQRCVRRLMSTADNHQPGDVPGSAKSKWTLRLSPWLRQPLSRYIHKRITWNHVVDWVFPVTRCTGHSWLKEKSRVDCTTMSSSLTIPSAFDFYDNSFHIGVLRHSPIVWFNDFRHRVCQSSKSVAKILIFLSCPPPPKKKKDCHTKKKVKCLLMRVSIVNLQACENQNASFGFAALAKTQPTQAWCRGQDAEEFIQKKVSKVLHFFGGGGGGGTLTKLWWSCSISGCISSQPRCWWRANAALWSVLLVIGLSDKHVNYVMGPALYVSHYASSTHHTCMFPCWWKSCVSKAEA